MHARLASLSEDELFDAKYTDKDGKEHGEEYKVTAKGLHVCKGPGVEFLSLGYIQYDDVVTALGVNDKGSEHSCSPANYPGVLAVGAINIRDRVARFSGSQLYKRAAEVDSIFPFDQ